VMTGAGEGCASAEPAGDSGRNRTAGRTTHRISANSPLLHRREGIPILELTFQLVETRMDTYRLKMRLFKQRFGGGI